MYPGIVSTSLTPGKPAESRDAGDVFPGVRQWASGDLKAPLPPPAARKMQGKRRKGESPQEVFPDLLEDGGVGTRADHRFSSNAETVGPPRREVPRIRSHTNALTRPSCADLHCNITTTHPLLSRCSIVV